MQKNIDVVRHVIGLYMLQAKPQSASHKIDNQRPFKIAVAVSSYNNDRRPNRAELIENALRANVTKMPDFISILGYFLNGLGQTIVSIGQNENAQDVFQLVLPRHV
jgi:hypothetical protein